MGLGQDHGGFSPFDILFTFAGDNETIGDLEPFSPKFFGCYEAISVSDCSFLLLTFVRCITVMLNINNLIAF